MTHLVRLLAATVLLTVGCTADYIAQQLYTDSACATTPFVSAFQLGEPCVHDALRHFRGPLRSFHGGVVPGFAY